jgi:hypothetical protein
MTEAEHLLVACSEKYAQLCALSTTRDLLDSEREELRLHLQICAACARVLAEYRQLAQVDFPELAGEVLEEQAALIRDAKWTESAQSRLIAELDAEPALESALRLSMIRSERKGGYYLSRMNRLTWAAVAAAVLLVTGSLYELGRSQATRETRFVSSTVTRAPSPLQAIPPVSASEQSLRQNLAHDEEIIRNLESHAAQDEASVQKLTKERASLQAALETASGQEQADTENIALLTQRRDELQGRVDATSQSLAAATADLKLAQDDRQNALTRASNLEARITELDSRLTASESTAQNDEGFLGKDRDIREVMGARQLYIADVFDVNQNGSRSKPFGRVFYTKGTSLLFYAFDLDAQPGYRQARGFQAWGRPEKEGGHPLSLGMFYMDSATNRRWVLKAEDPAVLAQINAVFVTVEPKDGSDKPTGKPFLYAYLRSLPPNHP